MVQEHVLAILPKGPRSLAAHDHAADVYSIAGPERKKRTELAIAIDGYGTNIYDVCCDSLVLDALLIKKRRFLPRNL